MLAAAAVLIKKAVIDTQRARIKHNCFASEKNDPAFAGSAQILLEEATILNQISSTELIEFSVEPKSHTSGLNSSGISLSGECCSYIYKPEYAGSAPATYPANIPAGPET